MRVRHGLLACLAATAILAPATARADEPPPAPPLLAAPPPLAPRVEKTRPRTGLLIAGAITWTVFYGLSIPLAVGGKDRGGLPGAIPLVGPFVAAGTYHVTHGMLDFSSLAPPLFIVTGVCQAAGVAMLTVSLAVPEKVPPNGEAGARLTITPLPGGIGVAGTF